MLINKITIGFVIQTFDTKEGKFVSQSFVAGQSDYENQAGEAVEGELLNDKDGNEIYLPFDMVQPK